MALRETTHTADADLFRQELANLINLRHPLVKLAQQIDWPSCERRFGDLYAAGVGRPGHPIRLMVGLQLLKHTCNVSDEEVVATWVENPYWQYFCGEQYFSHEPPIDPSLMTGFRKRIGEVGCEFMLGLTLSAGLATKTVASATPMRASSTGPLPRPGSCAPTWAGSSATLSARWRRLGGNPRT
jgi:transposase, IS5 family